MDIKEIKERKEKLDTEIGKYIQEKTDQFVKETGVHIEVNTRFAVYSDAEGQIDIELEI